MKLEPDVAALALSCGVHPLAIQEEYIGGLQRFAASCAALEKQAAPVEPVAYRHLHEDGWEYHDAPTGEDCAECQALYTAPPQQAEPC